MTTFHLSDSDLEDKELSKSKYDEHFIESGAHLAVVRSWIQNHCSNGETVRWSSTDTLRFRGLIPVLDLEIIAQKIANAVKSELTKEAK